MKITYAQNPLTCKVELDNQDLYLLRTALLAEAFDYELSIAYGNNPKESYTEAVDAAYEEVERVLPYYLSALNGETHMGDCTSVATACTKCHVEDYLSISTLVGIRCPYYVDKAFSDGRQTLDEAIKYLQDNPAKPTWEGSEPYVAKWQVQQDMTIEDLIEYRSKHFGTQTNHSDK